MPAAPAPETQRYSPVSDRDREHAAELLQRACGAGRLTLEEFGDRVAAVWAARTTAELEQATAGITPPLVGAPASSSTLVNILGDEKRVGRWRLPRRLNIYSLVGDWTLDLRCALVNQDAVLDGLVDITHVSILGNLKVVVPEGVDVELTGVMLLGDRKLELAPVPSHAGTPRIRLRVFGLVGNVTVRSAA